ncbi:hypothetical protein NB466_10445 [Vibrio fluvialis]|uniref:hypothetical protein n=1 Tax=Vibrio fluvialis TaxID=676 RepID=UPI00215BE258|nr:hypothetical protein [Vibrio fluvialis]MCR9299283.1 hypothetical protein [Vibrio fluvialis]
MEKLGILITFAWTILIAALVYLKWDQALEMSLNECGDFLAGATAPIAFLWLIIGYMLQRKELNLNTEALLMSKNEIARQANEMEAQTELLQTQARLAEGQLHEINTRYAMDIVGKIFKDK